MADLPHSPLGPALGGRRLGLMPPPRHAARYLMHEAVTECIVEPSAMVQMQ